MCVSTRERNQFPSVRLQPLGHLSPSTRSLSTFARSGQALDSLAKSRSLGGRFRIYGLRAVWNSVA